jgi:hypothetical protein
MHFPSTAKNQKMTLEGKIPVLVGASEFQKLFASVFKLHGMKHCQDRIPRSPVAHHFCHIDTNQIGTINKLEFASRKLHVLHTDMCF